MNFPKTPEKLQKVLARAGLGSRRQIETWICQGNIQINQRVATIGVRVSYSDDIRVNGRKLNPTLLFAPPLRILCYHKPIGEMCTRRDPKGRATIFEQLPKLEHGQWISVGRLDINTAGLLLLTTDGELAHRLMHPSYAIEREYAVRILGKIDETILDRLRKGIELDDGIARFKQIVDAGGRGANHWYHVTLSEGRKHEVRRLWESQGVTVSRLIRTRFGCVSLPRGLRIGCYVELNGLIVKTLLKQVNLDVPISS